jgi:biopolymer transport protein ExbD
LSSRPLLSDPTAAQSMVPQLRSLGADDDVIASINTTPLVDVMLVLLIIFLITIPVVMQTVPMVLPPESNLPRQTKPENIEVSVDREGRVYWNAQPVADHASLVAKLAAEGAKKPQPDVHVRGDQATRYESIGRVVLACQQAGIMKVSFVTQPASKN